MNKRVGDVAVTLRIGFLLAEVEHIGEPSMAISLQRAHAQFLRNCQTLGQPTLCIAQVSPMEVNFSKHSQRISFVRSLSVLFGEFEGTRGRR